MIKPALPTSFPDSLLAIACAGLVCYFIFKRLEPSGLYTLCALLIGIPGLLTPLLLRHYTYIAQAIAVTYATYISALITSIVVYRLSPLHPLSKYPGPLPNKISQLWLAWVCSKGKMHIYYKSLHEKYGDVVRIGPNELSLCDPAAIGPLMGAHGLPKGPEWDGRMPNRKTRSIIALRDPEEHARRRRLWNRGFNTAALKEYEHIIARRAIQLVSTLERQGRVVDLSHWLNYFQYDVMSDMVFGGGTDLMRDGDPLGLWNMMVKAKPPSMFFGHVPWLPRLYLKVFGPSKDLAKHVAFSRQRAAKRAAEGSLSKDLYHYLNDEEGLEPTRPSMEEVTNDGGIAILAGADTTSVTLANLFWFLLCNPQAYAHLQAEIDKYFPPGEDVFDTSKHGQMPYLNAVINETLRLLPPLLSGSQRAPPEGSGGKAVGPYYLPEGTNAFVHTYTVHRDPRNFSPSPEDFILERWLPADHKDSLHHPDYKRSHASSPDVVHNTAAFIPFSFGPAGCVGKNFAYQEMRMVVCLLLRKFDIRFAEGFRPQAWEENLLDYHTTTAGSLPVVLTDRLDFDET